MQLRSRPFRKEGNGPEVVIKRAISDTQLKEYALAYRIELKCFDDNGEHQHPRLAIERALLLDHLFSMIDRQHTHSGVVHDVFGNDAELRRRGVVHHSTMPVHHPSDSTRALSANPATSCSHEPHQCNCKRFAVGVCIQSLQYLKPDQLFAVMMNTQSKMLYAVVHRFRGIAGSFYNKEMKWFRSSVHTVNCSMDGGTTTWEHDALDWLDSPLYAPSYEGWCIVSTMIESIGESQIYRLTFQRVESAPPPLRVTSEWQAAMSSSQEMVYNLPKGKGELFERGYALAGYTMENYSFRTLPGVLVFSQGEEVQVVLSPPVVDRLVGYIHANAITPALYRQLLRQATGMYRDIPNFPANRISTAAMTSVMLALSVAPSVSVANLNILLYNQEEVFAEHNNSLAFTRARTITASKLGFLAISSFISYSVESVAPVTIQSGGPTAVHALLHVVNAVAVPILGTASTLTIPPLAMAWGTVQVATTAWWLWGHWGRHQNTAATNWVEQEPGGVSVLGQTVVHLDLRPSFGPLKRMKEPKAGKGEIDVKRQVEEPEDSEKLLQTGIAFSGVMPTYYPSDTNTLENALRSRLMIETPEPKVGAWVVATEIYKRTSRYKYYCKSGRVEFTRDDVSALMHSKYNVGKALNYLKEYDELVESGYILTPAQAQFGAFVKVEKQVALTIGKDEELPLEHDSKNPRCILSMSDRALAVNLAVVDSIAKGLQYAYTRDCDEHGGVAGIGPRWCSAEDIGEWAVNAARICGEAVFLSCDAERFDAHTKSAARRFGVDVCVNSRAFAENGVKKLMQPRPVVVKSRLGINLKLGVQRATGEGVTDSENSEITTATILYSICIREDLVHVLGTHYFIAACGDDNFTVLNKQFVNHLEERTGLSLKELVVARALELGYVISPIVSYNWTEAEYCSKLFYPVGETRVLGGKIGRVLAKAGWFFENDANPIQSACISQLRDNNHVPFLKEYFERVVTLTRTFSPSHGKEEVHSWHTEASHDSDEATWEFVTDRYGLTRQDLDEFVKLLSQCTSLPVVVDWVHLNRCIAIDNA